MTAPDAAHGAAEPREAHVAVTRTARYFTLGDARSAREVWLVLHGYGQLAGHFVRHFAPLADATGRLVVAPEALSRFYLSGVGGPSARIGASWMTREDRLSEIDDYVRALDRVLADATGGAAPGAAGAPRLCVLGFSQGAATACRWLVHRRAAGGAPAARLVLWGGGVPHDLDLARDGAALREVALQLVVGTDDEYATANVVAEQEERLRAAGVAFAPVRFAGGHRLDAEVLARVLGAVPDEAPDAPAGAVSAP